MSELLPTRQARSIEEGLLDYLTTTFALADDDARLALAEFLRDEHTGLFKGPYLRLRLPFKPADAAPHFSWIPEFTPYRHQAAAFARLSSDDLGPDKPRPLPTLITTGTGSGKTEAFLYPILDHVLRARRAGASGMKALILYPMNALANDQAKRLTELLTTREELAGITAALYTGQEGPARTKVTPDGLITDRAIIRDDAPDILLTNYKMLDQLLLRHEDQNLWAQSADSLQYLVLDEFHTYDGAQGTDVAMLLRRLGLAIKSHWLEGSHTDEEWRRPLGRITRWPPRHARRPGRRRDGRLPRRSSATSSTPRASCSKNASPSRTARDASVRSNGGPGRARPHPPRPARHQRDPRRARPDGRPRLHHRAVRRLYVTRVRLTASWTPTPACCPAGPGHPDQGSGDRDRVRRPPHRLAEKLFPGASTDADDDRLVFLTPGCGAQPRPRDAGPLELTVETHLWVQSSPASTGWRARPPSTAGATTARPWRPRVMRRPPSPARSPRHLLPALRPLGLGRRLALVGSDLASDDTPSAANTRPPGAVRALLYALEAEHTGTPP